MVSSSLCPIKTLNRTTCLCSMLSGWMPGASISLGRAKGAQIARQEARDTVDDDQDESPPSPLARKSALPGQASRDALPPRAPQAHHSRPVLPLDFILNPSKPIRNDNQQSSTLSVRNMPPLHRPPQNRLYHAASSPHLSRTRTSNHQIGGRSELRGRQSQSTLTQRAVSTLQRSHTSPQQRPPLEPRLRSRPKSKHAALSPILHASSGPLVPVLRTEDVVCRSTPGSRSASVEGGRSRRRSDSPPPLPFFLTPTFGDENSPMWTQSADRVRHLGIHTNSSSTSDSEDLHDGDDDQNPDDVDPNLERIIFSRALHHRDTSPPSSSTTTTTSSSQNNHSGLEPPATARRQRSIQSLRAHLVPRPTSVASSGKQRINYSRNPIITLATPRTAEARLPGRAVWLDGPEWDGQAVKSKKSRRGKDDGKRGLIPWFGGESAFIEQGSPRRPAATDSEWDGWE